MTSARAVLLLPLLVVGLLLVGTHARAEETFPLPDELKPDVDFWLSIFTRYDSNEGVLHDNRHLDVVYERVELSAKLSRRERQRRIRRHREAIQATLRTLAGGKRNGLSAEETRVLSLWPDGVSNQTLSAAVGRIRFQQGLSDRFREGLVRAGRWREHIETEFATLGVPLDLAALPHVESSYNPAARSHVGASGIWQFTRSTGRRFMRVDHVVDERNDPFEATRGAGRLLAFNYSIAGNWPMAITAYNHGLSGVRRAMRQHGDTAYVDIFRNYRGRTFGFASRNFYVAFLAAREVDLNPERYFPGVVPDRPTDYTLIELPDYVAAAELAKGLGVTEKELARHNPALQPTVWQGSKHIPRAFVVRLPAASLATSTDPLLAAIPAASWRNEQLPDLFHTIRRGDTLSEIAEAYDTRVSTLVALNGLSSRNRIRAGQRLRLPAAGPAPAAVSEPVVQAAVVASVDASVDAGASVADAVEPTAQPIGADALAAGAYEPVAEPIDADAPAVDAAEPAAIALAELEPAALVGDLATSLVGTLQTSLLSDPSDYGVAADNSVEVQPLETLGHLADWLGIRTQRLRDINGLAFRSPVEVGQRIRLDFAAVDVQTFESRRVAYHRAQQDSFFRSNRITGVTEHVLEPGESIWILSLRQYDVPIWLFRQYNPGLDMARVRAGVTVRFPTMVSVDPS